VALKFDDFENKVFEYISNNLKDINSKIGSGKINDVIVDIRLNELLLVYFCRQKNGIVYESNIKDFVDFMIDKIKNDPNPQINYLGTASSRQQNQIVN
jgi:hypothetical protein